MIDPVTPASAIPWRGKSYTLQLTNGCLAMASGELGIPILEGGPNCLFTKPEFYQRGVYLYALIRQKFPDVTLAECMDAVTGPKADAYKEILYEQVAELSPAIRRVMGIPEPETDARPTTDANSGEDYGPALASIAE